ncbi:MAG: leucyl/phenylalanyl-tRNA--protein transferase [Acidobacteria bacterium]|nr:leucyl/phenylalanyl-tRNA--protein transferase [Acidobacteriota bacterium]
MPPTGQTDQQPAVFFKRTDALMAFPDPRDAPYGDIVAVGGNTRPANLLAAYRRGIFPWPIEGWPLTWFSPRERAVLDFRDLHVPRRLARERRLAGVQFTFDQDFAGVVRACALSARPEQEGTWITREIYEGYCALHRLGHAHSVEARDGGALVGGLYGVDAGGAFGGESMFYARPNASKLALLRLVEHLAARGLDWLDIQVMTPHMHALGAKLISRDEFLDRLFESLARGLDLFPAKAGPPV